MSAQDEDRSYIEVEGMTLTGTFPVLFELEGYATGKRRNNVKVGMVKPERLRTWDIASDEGKFHGGDETAPKPLALFTAGVVTCFMTQVRTFARQCGVKVTALNAGARFEWVGKRNGQDPYTAHYKAFTIDIDLETDASLEAQKRLIRAASKGCFAEQVMSVAPIHRLRHNGEWVVCD
jgi:uncharacterized OsmC-like protein